MSRTLSSTEDLCGKWHPFVMRIVGGANDDAMDFPDGDGRIAGARELQDPAQSKELNTEDYVGLLREDVQVKR